MYYLIGTYSDCAESTRDGGISAEVQRPLYIRLSQFIWIS